MKGLPQPAAGGRISEWTSRFSEGLAAATAYDGEDIVFGYIDHKGKFVIPAHFSEAKDFSEGLAAVDTSSAHFNPTVWKAASSVNGPIYRVDSFKRFTREYRVIGMSRQKLISLLGEPDYIKKYGPGKHESYSLIGGNICGMSSQVCDIKYKDGIVSGCRFTNGGEWQTENGPRPSK